MPLSREHSWLIRNPELSSRERWTSQDSLAGAAAREGQAWRRAHHLHWYSDENVIYMLLAYSKGERDDLTASQKRALKKLVTEEFE